MFLNNSARYLRNPASCLKKSQNGQRLAVPRKQGYVDLLASPRKGGYVEHLAGSRRRVIICEPPTQG